MPTPSCLGIRDAIRSRRDRKRAKRQAELREIWEEWNIQSERQRQHELEKLKISTPTNADRVLTGLKWVMGTVAAVVVLPVAIAGAGVVATADAFVRGVNAVAGEGR